MSKMPFKPIPNSKILLVLILLAGFLLRLPGSWLPLMSIDEPDEFRYVKAINFDFRNPYLPLNTPVLDSHSLFPHYFGKLGILLFGDSLVGARLIYILTGVFCLFLIYSIFNEIRQRRNLISKFLKISILPTN